MDKYKLKKCALCSEEKEIKLSHIVPAFVGRHLKKTSVGNIRSMEEPNKTVQDLEKHYLLCHDCEERFSASERWFAREVFYPWKKNERTEFDYNSHLHYFITSLSWRSLYLDILNYVQDGNVDVTRLNVMIQSEQIMKEYLLGKRNDIGNIENHVFFFERIKEVHSSQDDAFYLNPHMTIHRSVTSYTHYSDDTIFTVSNMMGIIPVTLYEKGYRELWKGTEVICGDGKVLAANQQVTSVVCNEFQYWMKESAKQQEKMSETQKQKIIQRMKDIGNDIVNYADSFPYFVICTIRVKDGDKLKRVYKRFVAKHFEELKELDDGKMFNGNKFKELKGSCFDCKMKEIFAEYFCRSNIFEVYYIKVLNSKVKSKLYKNTARAFNFLYKLKLIFFLKRKFLPNDEYIIQFDNRNQKNDSKNSLEDYLNTELHLNEELTEEIHVKYFNSENNKFIQIADVFSNIFYSYCFNPEQYSSIIKKAKKSKILKGVYKFPYFNT